MRGAPLRCKNWLHYELHLISFTVDTVTIYKIPPIFPVKQTRIHPYSDDPLRPSIDITTRTYHHVPYNFFLIYLILFFIYFLLRYTTQFRTRVFVFQFFSVQGGNSTDVKIHSSEVKMYSADVKIQVKIRSQQIAI